MARIDAFLELGREQGCSDIHFSVGLPPLLRIDGELIPVKYRDISADEMKSMVSEIMDDAHRTKFKLVGAVDVSYSLPKTGRFRINVSSQASGMAAVCRVIPDKVVPLEKLGLPPVVGTVADLNAGLVLVTGATGTGKSSTLAAILEEINRRKKVTILALEDPIEFLHESKEALIIQREIGRSVTTYAAGLRSALRQDPDVIMVGELADPETTALALEASETGHLVLATMHTRGAAQSIDRILDSFPKESHAQIRNTLAENLRCVFCQELIRAADGRGQRVAVEVMVNNTAVAQHIREGRTFQIASVMSTGRRLGMQLMDQSLLALVRAGEVDPDEAFLVARSKREFLPFVTDKEAFAPLAEMSL